LERQVPLECEVSVQEGEIPKILGIPEVLRPRGVANQLQIAGDLGGILITGAESDAWVIVADGDAIALRSGSRREKRPGKYE